MNNFSDMVSKAKKIQEQMKEVQENLKKIEVEGTAGGDLVKVILRGDYEMKSISINSNAKDEKEEIINDLIIAAHNDAREKLKKLEYANVTVKWGDGYQGWIEHAPFDAIIVTAAPDQVPQALIEQLKPEGRLVIPVGTYYQELKVITKGQKDQIQEENIIAVRFVPMVHPKGATLDSKPVPTRGASLLTKGTACLIILDPISALLASSFSKNGISDAATETNC